MLTKEDYLKNRDYYLKQQKLYREKNKEAVNASQRRRYNLNKEKQLLQKREHYSKHKDELMPVRRQQYKRFYDSTRSRLFEILGGPKCSNIDCPIPKDKMDVRVLQFDHISGGGNKELKARKNTALLMRHYVKHPEEAKQKLQVLCVYCNWIKRYEKKEDKCRLVV